MLSKNSMSIEKASNDALNELEQLRLIVFGQAKVELEQKLDNIQQQLSHDISSMNEQFTSKLTDLDTKLNDFCRSSNSSIAKLEGELATDKSAIEEQLKAQQQAFSSQLEMAESATKDESAILEKRIDEEVAKLETNVETSLLEIVTKLENLGKELSSSKTDRKTLAKLLADMANDLNADT